MEETTGSQATISSNKNDITMEETTSAQATISSNKGDFLAQFDPAFIHQVLLTDQDEFSSLVDPKSRFTFSFQEFMEESPMDKMDIRMGLKKAVQDHIAERLSQHPGDLAPLRGLLLELHQQLRALIPHRKDLHTVLDGDQVKKSDSIELLQTLIVKAASSLLQLESESRAVTTRELLGQIQNSHDNSHEYWANVIVYLLYKAELCQADKRDFYLVHAWAPRIHQEGPAQERKLYEEKNGMFDDPDSSPSTRKWIEDLIKSQQTRSGGNPQAQESDSEKNQNDAMLARLLESEEERKTLIRQGWVDDIVFRGSNQRSMSIPEVFAQDIGGLQQIREVTRLAVAGCSLALHARTAAGITTQEDASDSRKMALLKALRAPNLTPNVYEDTVVDEVIAMAQEWSPDKVIDAESLRGRVVAVLQGKDPVLQLLNARIKVATRDVILQKLHHAKEVKAPKELRTGLVKDGRQSPVSGQSNNKRTVIETMFCRRGLAFFASELALVAERAGKIVDLAIDLYWDDVLDKLVLEQCNETIAFALD